MMIRSRAFNYCESCITQRRKVKQRRRVEIMDSSLRLCENLASLRETSLSFYCFVEVVSRKDAKLRSWILPLRLCENLAPLRETLLSFYCFRNNPVRRF